MVIVISIEHQPLKLALESLIMTVRRNELPHNIASKFNFRFDVNV